MSPSSAHQRLPARSSPSRAQLEKPRNPNWFAAIPMSCESHACGGNIRPCNLGAVERKVGFRILAVFRLCSSVPGARSSDSAGVPPLLAFGVHCSQMSGSRAGHHPRPSITTIRRCPKRRRLSRENSLTAHTRLHYGVSDTTAPYQKVRSAAPERTCPLRTGCPHEVFDSDDSQARFAVGTRMSIVVRVVADVPPLTPPQHQLDRRRRSAKGTAALPGHSRRGTANLVVELVHIQSK